MFIGKKLNCPIFGYLMLQKNITLLLFIFHKLAHLTWLIKISKLFVSWIKILGIVSNKRDYPRFASCIKNLCSLNHVGVCIKPRDQKWISIRGNEFFFFIFMFLAFERQNFSSCNEFSQSFGLKKKTKIYNMCKHIFLCWIVLYIIIRSLCV